MQVVITVLKGVLLHLVTKYAAELLFDYTVKVLDKAAAKTETDFDDQLVLKVAAERAVILGIIKQGQAR
jgi:hypothetical protein